MGSPLFGDIHLSLLSASPQRSSAAPRRGPQVLGPALVSAALEAMVTGPALSRGAMACCRGAVSLAVGTAAPAGRPKPGWGM